MLKFFSGVFVGMAIIVLGGYGLMKYSKSPRGQVTRCMALYLENADELRNSPEIQEAMKREGFASLEEITKARCENWIKNGQRF